MTEQSIYQRALGPSFTKLHPRLQQRFSMRADQHRGQIGRGEMQRVWRGRAWTLPFLLLGAHRRVLFPAQGHDVPFTVSNYAYVDELGRETVTWSRRFRFPRKVRAFDATMVWSEDRGRIIDYIGSHQHLAVEIDCSVVDGALCLRSGDMRFHEGPLSFRFPQLLWGQAEVREWFDDGDGRFHIEVAVTNRRFGPLFGYEGTFDLTEHPCPPEHIPLDVLPVRTERRT